MPPQYAWDIYPANDPAGKISTSLEGSRLVRLTIDSQLVGGYYRDVGWGVGDGEVTIHTDHAAATETNFAKRNYAMFVRIDTTPDQFIGGIFFEEGLVDLLSESEERGGRMLTFKGAGGKVLLDRYRLGSAIYAPGALFHGDYDLPGDFWTWEQKPLGAILKRMVEEGQNDPPQTFAAINTDFTRLLDSNNNAWNVELSNYQTRIGPTVLEHEQEFAESGLLTRMTAFLELQAYRDVNEFRTDRTGAFGAGNVRFEKGVNILGRMPRRLAASQVRTHVITKDRLGQIDTIDTDLDNNPIPGVPYYDYLESTTTDDDAAMIVMGQTRLTRRLEHSDQARVVHIIDDDPTNGKYAPGPEGDYWVLDLVTLHTGSDSQDFDETPLEIAAIKYFFDDAGNPFAEVELGAQFVPPALDAYQQNLVSTIVRQVGSLQLCQPRVEVEAAGIDFGSGSLSTSVRVSTGGGGGGTTAALPSGAEVGHLAVANGYLNGTGTIPTLPSGWTAIGAGGAAGSGAQNIGQRGCWKILETADAEGADWPDAHGVIVTVLKGFDPADPIGGIAGGSGSGSTVTWSVPTFEVGDGTSWALAFGAHDGDASLGGNAMSGSPAASVLADDTHHGGWYSADAASWGAHTVTASASDDWVQTVYEIRAAASGTVFPGDGKAELVGTSTKAKRCDDTEHWHQVGSGSPTVNDDVNDGFRNGTLWINDNGEVWYLADNAAGAADWIAFAGGVDLTGINFLVGTATGLLSNEIAVGTTPGGQLNGTWASPNVDDVHGTTTPSAHLALGTTAGTAAEGNHTHAGGSSGQRSVLLESGHAVPFTFDEILQESDGSDFLWSSE